MIYSNRDQLVEAIADKVYAIFRLFGWEYFDGPPTLGRLEEVLYGLISEVTDKGGMECGTGRLLVQREDGESNEAGEPLIRVLLELGDFYDGKT